VATVVGAGLAFAPPTPRLMAFFSGGRKSHGAHRLDLCRLIHPRRGRCLDGRHATTHWAYAQELQRCFPKIRVEMDRIFIADGSVWTSAGMTAGIDMALGLIARDMGADVARATARMMVGYHRRVGDQSQHSAMLELDAKSVPASRVFRTELASRLPRRLNIFDSKPRDCCWSKVGCQLKKLLATPGSATRSGCAAASCAPSGRRPRLYATLHTRLPPFKSNPRKHLSPDQNRLSGVFAAPQICLLFALKDLSRRHKDLP
jgi:hypothetical protein